MVILHDPKTAKAVLNDENYAGRDQNFEFVKLFKNNGLYSYWRPHTDQSPVFRLIIIYLHQKQKTETAA